jgi:hypothetical protein
MTGRDFERIVTRAYTPFLTELGFLVEAPHISGRFYAVCFASDTHRVSLSYEPGDDWANLSVHRLRSKAEVASWLALVSREN